MKKFHLDPEKFHCKHSNKVVSEILPTSYGPLYIRLPIRFFKQKGKILCGQIMIYSMKNFMLNNNICSHAVLVLHVAQLLLVILLSSKPGGRAHCHLNHGHHGLLDSAAIIIQPRIVQVDQNSLIQQLSTYLLQKCT